LQEFLVARVICCPLIIHPSQINNYMNIGFTTEEHPKSPRLITVTLDQTTARNFCEQINDFSIQAIENEEYFFLNPT